MTAVLAAIVVSSTGGSASPGRKPASAHSRASSAGHASTPASGAKSAVTVPILAYQVINTAPSSISGPTTRYVPVTEFSAQMDALKANGWHAVTLNQLESNWTRAVPLGAGKPIVITFDNGYGSHYANALPVLKRLGWVGVENLQVNGLPASDGGLTDSQIRSLITAGWELDTAGLSQADLTTLGATQLSDEVATARRTLQSRYGANVNWFSYPSGSYDPTVMAAVRAAGFVGSTTLIPGWASAQEDRFRLPRIPVGGGTSPTALLSAVSAAQQDPSPPDTARGP